MCTDGTLWQSCDLTVLEDLADVGLLALAATVTLHVREHAALVGPEVVLRTEEEDGELANLVPQVLDVGGDVPWVADLCRPPPERAAPGQKSETSDLKTRAPLTADMYITRGGMTK